MPERSPGFEDYIPSRIEWLSYLLNSISQYINPSISIDNKINRYYTPKSDGKTIVLLVKYPKEIDSDLLEKHINIMVDQAKDIAKIYEWDSWVEIEVNRQPQE